MSFEATAIVMNHSQASGSARMILVGIASHDGDGGSWPSVAKLARYANVSPRAAQKAIAQLEELGEIRRYIQQGGTQRTAEHMRTNYYEILLTCPPECDGSKNHNLIESEPDDLVDNSQDIGVSPSSPGEPQFTRGVNPSSPELPINYPLPKDEISTNDVSAREAQNTVAALNREMDRNAMKPVKRPDLSKTDKPFTKPAPAPRIPRFAPDPPKLQPLERSALEEAAVTAAQRLPCPQGFGTGLHARHWFPGGLTGCAQCGKDAQSLTDRNPQ